MIVVAVCPWCKHSVDAEDDGSAVRCGNCKKWFFSPVEQPEETLKQCKQCGRRCDRFADNDGQRCYICTMPTP